MPRVSATFYLLSCLCLLIGMGWGMHMAQSSDFTMAPAHAHLNLLGGVLSAIFGTFYALTRETYSPRLAWINFLLSLIAVVVTIPALAMLLMTNDDAKYGPVTGIGSAIMVLSLLTFTLSVVREVMRRR
jgi:ABC-type proline/glycine betaine transport system permease subunit